MNSKESLKISRQNIIDWLSTPTTSEKLFQSHYERTGQTVTIEDLYQSPTHTLQGSVGMEANTDFQSLTQNYIQLKESIHFLETDWFHPFYDVSIHKHLRYFPAFLHKHSFFEMCYVISGNCTQYISTTAHSFNLNLHTGDILVIPPEVKHALSMNSDSIVVNILIRKSTLENAFLNNIPSDTVLYKFFLNTLYAADNERYILCHSGSDYTLVDLFFHIAETYCNNDIYANNIIDQLLTTFFCIMLRDYSSSIEFVGENSPCLELIPSILQYMEKNYAHTSIQDIAEHFGFNASYLGQMFKQSTSSTLIQALVQIRISKAKHLLQTTTISVDMIAEMVGYQDTTHFIRIFKKATGTTPLQFRKNK